MNMTDEQMVDYVACKLPIGERLAQLAEEATELAQAALKYRRAVTPDASPTSKTGKDALDNLIEEIEDVKMCVDTLQLGDTIPDSVMAKWRAYKMPRWVERIKAASKKGTEQ